MDAAGVATSLLVLLAANNSSVLDCVCNHVANVTDEMSYGDGLMWETYCQDLGNYYLFETCENLEAPSVAVPAATRLVPRRGHEEDEECGRALAEVRHLTEDSSRELTRGLIRGVAADCIRSCSVQGLDNMEWNLKTLQTDRLRGATLTKLLHAVQQITRAIKHRNRLVLDYNWEFLHNDHNISGTELRAEIPVFLEHLSDYWRDSAQLLSLGVKHFSQLLVPLAFEQMRIHSNDLQRHEWINSMKHLRDMLHTRLSGWVHDVQSVSEQMAYYKVEEHKNRPGTYILRRPLLNHDLLSYHERFLSFRDDFTALCVARHRRASQMFGLADALYSFYYYNWFFDLQFVGDIESLDEEWQREDRSNAMFSVDTDCVQLLANALDHPTCPLEDLPPETKNLRERCREQLWDDVVQRSPHVPVTSYLAYTQRINVNLCLLAWMTANSFGEDTRQLGPPSRSQLVAPPAQPQQPDSPGSGGAGSWRRRRRRRLRVRRA
ncbi:uncharacterized protein LOC124553527 [Schistocerca americana]|uniref:uncharacterized protein LOC124553527 n=1 Tax=Schistocerca americana TaxID=7009 RepID=UPI001F4F60F9|nr:uncharacterized protein LOC124553527 [Schistocerca americana]